MGVEKISGLKLQKNSACILTLSISWILKETCIWLFNMDTTYDKKRRTSYSAQKSDRGVTPMLSGLLDLPWCQGCLLLLLFSLNQCTVQNLLNRERLRYSGVFLALINLNFYISSFGPKSRDNPLKYFHQLWDIGQISRQLTCARPNSDHFPRAAAPKAGKSGHPNF